jgi:hypothetical protein
MLIILGVDVEIVLRLSSVIWLSAAITALSSSWIATNVVTVGKSYTSSACRLVVTRRDFYNTSVSELIKGAC